MQGLPAIARLTTATVKRAIVLGFPLNNRGFKGIWIPASVWLSSELTLIEKVLLAEIDSLDNPPSGCTASNAYFGEFFGFTSDHASKQVRKLEAKGLINCTYDNDSRRTIRVSSRGKMFIAAVLPKSAEPRKESPEPGEDGPETEVLPPSAKELGGVVQKNYPPSAKELPPLVQKNYHITKEDNKGDNKEDILAQAPKNASSQRFVKPSVDEAEAYLQSIGVPAGQGAAFVDKHDASGWRVSHEPMKDWRAACRTWKRHFFAYGHDKQAARNKTGTEAIRDSYEETLRQLQS